MGTEYMLVDTVGRRVLSINKWSYLSRIVRSTPYPSTLTQSEPVTFDLLRKAMLLAVEDGQVLFRVCQDNAAAFIRDAVGSVFLMDDGSGDAEGLWTGPDGEVLPTWTHLGEWSQKIPGLAAKVPVSIYRATGPEDCAVWIDYLNHRGVRRWRQIVPTRIYYGATDWHPEDQWLLAADDVTPEDFSGVPPKGLRTFALTGIYQWTPDAPGPRTVTMNRGD